MLRGGMAEREANAVFAGIIVGSSWARGGALAHLPDVIEGDRAADELAKDILAACESFKPNSVPVGRVN